MVYSDIECLVCNGVVKFIIQELQKDRTEQAIISGADRVCSLFFKKERSRCHDFVEKYTDKLIHILTEETDPKSACTLVGFCIL